MPEIPPEPVAAIRRFNRFYTRQIGALDEAHLGEPFGLAEGRVLYEIAQAGPNLTPGLLALRTGLDAGYLSRILKRFEGKALIARVRSAEDGRSWTLSLTDPGWAAYEHLRRVAEGAVEAMIGTLASDQRARLTAAMGEIETLLGAPAPGDIRLRSHRVGDMGWVTERHATLYARDYGWDERFEALVARICADFVERLEPAREHCWIAEREGARLGSVFLVQGDRPGQAKLRLLLIEPSARGLGLGKRLVAQCVAFARACGYDEVSLWTQSILTAARGVYAAAGFELIDQTPHMTIGVPLVGETWRLRL
ncbi:bifunctional helix-turn-helix transcriptional regulator/GNAT family N-acetyltransferase [Phenylobacterium aquaticum]|uniref:bifunctional helix-turn-helix transcriptional regulator/GNAT family N-acetyltransferase n=1 Tax=Phenylobacterium aquaticum TaxID=1763816 RepID=UPI0026EDAB66|nr:bifunctional helix-turn-helix transcriptional regulator/GNAT family N-acetyltransferase [Phenylobacterium aquaticum]